MNATGPLMDVTTSPTPARAADVRDRDRAADQRHRAANQRDQAGDDPE